MIETLLNDSPETLKSQFTAGLFYQDTAGAMDSHVVSNGPNRGLTQRARFSAESKEFQVLGPLHADIFFCERLLLNSVDIRVKLTRGSDAFCLMHAANRDYRLHVLSGSLFVKKVTVAAAVRIGYSAALYKRNALYPLSRINLKTFFIPANSRICTQENLFLGTLPNFIVLGLVNHKAFTGSSNLNPFNFIHCDLEYLAICQNGRQILANLLSLSLRTTNVCENIIIYFRLRGCSSLHPVRTGTLRLELRFRVPLRQL
ncbi:hypothetical protein Q5P01_010584 [Channa striata]|uniref:Uncharacterized protein n=1 Tax=Channa striata TaxID=64152 RepID=A0AA88ST99_CHASR|nr:hypothetical protein Q5P01_010584 [Channa striata]